MCGRLFIDIHSLLHFTLKIVKITLKPHTPEKPSMSQDMTTLQMPKCSVTAPLKINKKINSVYRVPRKFAKSNAV